MYRLPLSPITPNHSQWQNTEGMWGELSEERTWWAQLIYSMYTSKCSLNKPGFKSFPIYIYTLQVTSW